MQLSHTAAVSDVASGAQWASLLSTTTTWCVLLRVCGHTQALSLTSLAFVPQIVAGGQNGVGACVWKSTDGGKTLNTMPHDSAMMLMSAAADQNDKVTSNVGGFLSSQFSNDTAASFHKAIAGSGGPCQSVEAVKGAKGQVMLTGQTIFWNGVGISSDGGKHFSVNSVWPNNSPFGARYGAAPSSKVLYVTGGSWPSNNNAETVVSGDFHSVTERIHVHPTNFEMRIGAGASNLTQYTGAIAKSTDGGKTWKTLYSVQGVNEYYFNGSEFGVAHSSRSVAGGDRR